MSQTPVLESSVLVDSHVSRLLHWFATHAEQAMFVGGADGRVQWANEAACRLSGARLDELVGRRVQLFPDDAEPLVRGHAAWALGRIASPAARRALLAAEKTEPDGYVCAEIARALQD